MKNKILPVLLLVALGFVGVFSCKKSTTNPVDPSPTTYFPLKIGKYITYAVDSTFYVDSLCKKVTVSSQIRYTVADSTVDTTLLGRKKPTFIIDVLTRPNGTSNWTAGGPILVTPTDSSILYTQATLTYIKLVVPMVNGLSWKGNSMINFFDSTLRYTLEWDYTYDNWGQSFNTGYENFNNTITVRQHNDSVLNTGPSADTIALSSKIYAKEVYANNVGLIYREFTHYSLNQVHAPCVGGITVIMRAIDHN